MAAKKELLLIEIREDGARVVKRNITDVGKAGDATTDKMGKLKTILAGLISAKVLRDVVLLADSYANMLNRLRVVTEGTWELHKAMSMVYDMSRQTRTALEANIDMYARIALNTKQMGLEMKDVVRFATQLNHAIILSGVTAREAQWGMVQFSQGLAAGALRGDELRSVMEQLPVVTETLTKFLGIGRGELRKWAFEGRVTTRVIIDAFNEAEKNLAERFGRRIPTVDQALTVLRNSITKFIGDLDQAMQGTGQLAQALLWASDNMDTLARFVGAAGLLLGGIFLVNLIKIVAQMKLFSLGILTMNPILTILLLAGTALVVFSDKIKIATGSATALGDEFTTLGEKAKLMTKDATDSTATLGNVFTAFGEKAKLAYMVMRDGASEVAKDVALLKGDVKTIWQIMLDDVVWFVDGVQGLFTGMSKVIRWVFDDIPNNGARAWNGLLTGLETVIDYITAVFATIGDIFRIMSINIDMGMTNLAASMDNLFRGNFKQAAKYGDQAALAFSNAAKTGMSEFSTLLEKNLKLAASQDSLAGAKIVIKEAGKTMGEVFIEGFGEAGFAAGLLRRAKEIAAVGDTGGPNADRVAVFSPTPVQSQLLKDMVGDIGKVNNQMAQLKELWAAINTQQPGTEGMQFTLEQMTRRMTELKLKAMEVNTDVISGFQRGFLKLGLEISDFASLAEKTIVNAFKSMEDALVSFVTTGKINFKSLVDGMLADLTRLLARQALMGLLNSVAAGAGGGGGGGWIGSLANLIGGTAKAVGTTAAGAPGVAAIGSAASGVGATLFGNPPERALGGLVSPGMDYLVGERRPEIFRPAQPGTIIPQAAAQQPVQETPITIINVGSEEEALAAMGSAEGTRIIRNEFRKSGKA